MVFLKCHFKQLVNYIFKRAVLTSTSFLFFLTFFRKVVERVRRTSSSIVWGHLHDIQCASVGAPAKSCAKLWSPLGSLCLCVCRRKWQGGKICDCSKRSATPNNGEGGNKAGARHVFVPERLQTTCPRTVQWSAWCEKGHALSLCQGSVHAGCSNDGSIHSR